ncbi:30S ribosomal protein S4 [Methanobacterium paludis]|uniref:Small ribosomal subunit protein uS4 n=1 Tax=Methanobacterium paludis (strain DSM 25820 / JCM 18151 / SWAN1) TaxID=868131 RepID=F6D7I6_METPW|nr:30S ribosomal protein S4 [Methanobacterium paludis]AEG18453.1 ribosomal protein S4 [Methanobacterium paludis]
MGHPRKARKQYDTPSHPWNADRIKEENKLVQKYGLKNKKEIWKASTTVKRYRRDARYLLGTSTEEQGIQGINSEGNQLLGHLITLGILAESAKLEDILDLTVEDVLRRRLQTMVHKTGLSHTAKEARVFIVHGHIALNGKKINAPGYMVRKAEEELLGFYPGSAVEKQHKEEAQAREKAAEKTE